MRPALIPLAPGLFSAQHCLSMPGLTVRTRMTVVCLPGNQLCLHSPVPATAELRQAVQALGDVAWVVAPNRMHHLYAGDWLQHSPRAQLWAAPGLAAKRPDLPPMQSLATSSLPAAWQGQLRVHFFAGIPLLQESVFLHEASGSLLLTDLLQYYPQDLSFSARLFNALNGTRSRLAMPRAVRFTLRDREAARRSAATITAWPVQRIVLAHDTVIEQDAQAQLQAALGFLLS